jgi:hypothetical protein
LAFIFEMFQFLSRRLYISMTTVSTFLITMNPYFENFCFSGSYVSTVHCIVVHCTVA